MKHLRHQAAAFWMTGLAEKQMAAQPASQVVATAEEEEEQAELPPTAASSAKVVA